MEKEKQSLFQQYVNDGVILGVILCVINILFYLIIDLDKFSFWSMIFVSTMIGFMPLIVGLIILMVKYKKNFLGGFMSYGQGLKYGTIITFVAAIIVSIYTVVFNNFIDPDFTKKTQEIVMNKTYEFMKESNVPDNVIDDKIGEMEEKLQKEVENAKIIAPLKSILTTTLIGFIISLILAAIIKKNRAEFEEQIL